MKLSQRHKFEYLGKNAVRPISGNSMTISALLFAALSYTDDDWILYNKVVGYVLAQFG